MVVDNNKIFTLLLALTVAVFGNVGVGIWWAARIDTNVNNMSEVLSQRTPILNLVPLNSLRIQNLERKVNGE